MMSALDYRARGVTGDEAMHRALATLVPRVKALAQEHADRELPVRAVAPIAASATRR